MADNKKMSVEDILKACRQEGGGGAEASDAGAPAEPAAEPSKPAAKPPAEKSGEMSVADILAAARSDAGEGGGSDAAAEPAAEAEQKPTSKPAGKPGEMSVTDILAAARGEGAAAAKPKPAAKAKAAPKAAKAPAKSSKAAAKPPVGPMDTSSILAAARKTSKPGPMSKAEAAAKGIKPKGKSAVSAPAMPAKPDYARPKVAASSDEGRRGFVKIFIGSFLAVGFTTLTLTNLLWVLGLARFMFPNILIEPPSKFKVGFPMDFAPGTVDAKFKAQFGVWLVNAAYQGEQQIVALKTVCTHLGCTPNWLEAEQKFKCPCHGSGFYKDGVNFEGPAPRPLERYAISLSDDGQLEVDKSKTFQEEMGQWKDGASFVPV